MKIYLFVYLLVSLILVFALPTYRTYKKTGINPITFGKEDNAHNYVGKVFKVLILLLLLVFAINVFSEEVYWQYMVPITYLQNDWLYYTGVVLMHLSMLWIFIAQIQMGKSWRIGIDEKHKTELVKNGLFSISRNPIFLGMILAIISVFMVLPNIFTFFVAFAGYIVIQIQIRLEEEFLLRRFGVEYTEYQAKTRRLI